MKKTHIVFLAVFIALTTLLSFIVFGTLGMIFLGLANYDKYLAKQLDNPYINSEYNNWQPTTFFGNTTVYMPENWHVAKDSDIYQITDQENCIIAFCAFIDHDTSRFQESSEFLSELVAFDVEDIARDYSIGLLNEGCKFSCRANVQGNASQSQQFICVALGQGDPYCCLVFPINEETDFDGLSEILDAIIYSFEFM